MTIKVDYAVLESAMGQIRTISKKIDTELDTLRDGLQKLHWYGADREAYDTHQAKWDAAVVDLNRVLGEISVKVGAAREAYITTEANNSYLWG